MKILTDEEIWDLYDDKGLIQNARAIESAVVEKLKDKLKSHVSKNFRLRSSGMCGRLIAEVFEEKP